MELVFKQDHSDLKVFIIDQSDKLICFSAVVNECDPFFQQDIIFIFKSCINTENAI